ncbi:MAG TPA: methyltransferase domain-containing protein [Candidatus Bathyarchaeia archaeon]|nr:methyltransferase domain-containing protein [Candidatus Bathyarchaeia archaeon]
MSGHNTLSTDEQMRREFNEWAEAGRGEEMEHHHINITQQTLALMKLKPGEKVLDLGCGAGWASRLLAQLVGGGARPGQVVGLDVSDEMIRRARANSADFDNVLFVVGSALQIPWEENFFDKVLSVESFYYYGDQDRALDELFRVLAPRGELYILINLYKDNPYSQRWVEELKVPVQMRSEQDYIELLRDHGYQEVRAQRIPDLSPTPEEYSGKWFANAEELRDFKRIGALLLIARKPDVESPPRSYELQ